MNTRRMSLSLAAMLSLTTASAALAGQVTVSSPDGLITITGELVSFDDQSLTIDSEIGSLTLARNAVNCSGDDCPVTSQAFNMDIAVTDDALVGLLQAMTDNFAKTAGMTALAIPSATGSLDRIEMMSADSEGLGEAGMDLAMLSPEEGFNALTQGNVTFTLGSNGVPAPIAASYVEAGNTDLRDERRERVIALDAIVPVVHPNNPVRSVSVSELAEIAAGRITNWSQLGGEDLEIRAILPAAGSALDVSMQELVLDPNRVRLRRRGAERINDLQAAVDAVMQDPSAITVTGMSGVDEAKVVPIRQICGPLANATDFTIKAEEYPLSRRILGYTGQDSYAGYEQQFLDYIVSDDAQPVIDRMGFVDQTVVAEPVGKQGTRMTSAILTAGGGNALGLVQQFTRDLATADRLSTTFRFSVGSSNLDTKAVDDVSRMVEYLQTPDARLREILVIGFTDDVGRFDLNTRLAELRAQSVRDALLASPGGDVLANRVRVSSYGPLAPVGCNETAAGRDSNRRVEIWLR